MHRNVSFDLKNCDIYKEEKRLHKVAKTQIYGLSNDWICGIRVGDFAMNDLKSLSWLKDIYE